MIDISFLEVFTALTSGVILFFSSSKVIPPALDDGGGEELDLDPPLSRPESKSSISFVPSSPVAISSSSLLDTTLPSTSGTNN